VSECKRARVLVGWFAALAAILIGAPGCAEGGNSARDAAVLRDGAGDALVPDAPHDDDGAVELDAEPPIDAPAPDEDSGPPPVDAPARPAIASVDYPVVAHGARLQIEGTGFTGASGVRVGDVAQTFRVDSDARIVIDALADATPTGAQSAIVSAPAGDSAPFAVTVIHLVVSEVDADQTGTDTTELIEISTGVPGVSLSGYVLVAFDGASGASYCLITGAGGTGCTSAAIELDATADANGFVVVGNAAVRPAPAIAVPDNTLQNGADAIAIYQGASVAFPSGTRPLGAGLLDAVVYDTSDADSTALLDALLGIGRAQRMQVDEDANGMSAVESIQRCDSARLDGRAFVVRAPTPGALGFCAVRISSVDYPVIAHGGRLIVSGGGFRGTTEVRVGGLAQAFVESSDALVQVPSLLDATPTGLQPVVVTSAAGTSPALSVTVVHLVLGEVDSDQASTDATEIVEVSAGAPGISLAGYTVVLFNGGTDTSYASYELASADGSGRVLLGNPALVPAPAIVIPANTLQNGADAVAIYQGRVTDYPSGTRPLSLLLIDALVYGTDDPDDAGLLDPLLGAVGTIGRAQVNENVNLRGTTESMQRCSAERRDGRAWRVLAPTPGGAIACP